MRVATYNLLDLFEAADDREKAIVDQKLSHLAGLLREADADVVALQEIGSEQVLSRLVDGELSALGYRHLTLGEPDPRGIRIGIISRLPVRAARVVARQSISFPRLLVDDPEPFAGGIPLRRGLVHVCVEAPPPIGPVDVITLHFKSKLGAPMKDADGNKLWDDSARGKGEAALRSLVLRAAEALFLRETVDALLAAGAQNVIALGDFNDDAHSLSLSIVAGEFEGVAHGQVLTNLALRAPEGERFSVLHRGKPSLIDHVLASPQLAARWLETRILNGTLRDHGPFTPDAKPAPDSDHAPVVVTFDAT